MNREMDLSKRNLCSLIADCFNFQTKSITDFDHISKIEIVHQFIKEKFGKDELNILFESEELQPYLLAMLSKRNIRDDNFVKATIQRFLDKDTNGIPRKLKNEHHKTIKDFVTASSLKGLIASNSNKEDGWITNEWFEKMGKRIRGKNIKLSQHEHNILDLQICLLVGERCNPKLLESVWPSGISSIRTRKNNLMGKFSSSTLIQQRKQQRQQQQQRQQHQHQKQQRWQLPLTPIKASTTSLLNGLHKQKQFRGPPTPFVSPSMIHAEKKARKKSPFTLAFDPGNPNPCFRNLMSPSKMNTYKTIPIKKRNRQRDSTCSHIDATPIREVRQGVENDKFLHFSNRLFSNPFVCHCILFYLF